MPERIIPDFQFGDSDPVSVTKLVKRVAIIGGGASGAIALDSLIRENHFEQIVLYERRDVLGGVWVLDQNPIDTPADIIKPGRPSRDIDPPLDNPFRLGVAGEKIRSLWSQQQRFEQTPAYDGMVTNIIENLMTYSDEREWIAKKKNEFVDRSAVREYIERYIKRHENNTKTQVVLETTVEDVEKVSAPATSELPYQYKLTLRHRLPDGTDEWYQQIFDAIIVTVGHYHIPFIPDVPGLTEVQNKYPEAVHHAKFFRNAQPYKNKTVLVIGSRALGADLTKFSADTAVQVYQLIRNEERTKRFTRKDNVTFKPIVTKYELTSSGFNVHFADETVLENPDVVVYATGYQFSYPFLQRLYGDITLDGKIVPDLYQHTFYNKAPTIAWIGVPTDAISFRAFEYQAIVVARYLAGKISLPNRIEQRKWLDKRLEGKGITRAFHTIGFLDATDYLDTLTELGRVKDLSVVGREFPKLRQEELDELKEAAVRLSEFWDEPRIKV